MPSSSRTPFTSVPAVRRSRRRMIAALSVVLIAAGAGPVAATPGELTQLEDTDACVSHTGTDGACSDGKALETPGSIAISPDSKFVYVAATGSDSLAVLQRDTTSGALTQLEGTDGCVSDNGTGGACGNGRALVGPVAVTVTPDGKFLYATSQVSNAVSAFKRNKATGGLTQISGKNGCIGEGGSAGDCNEGRALDRPYGLVVSPDGKHIYVASENSYAVAAFLRNKITGVLTQLQGLDGCVSEGGTGGQCAEGHALREARALAISPDGKHVYVASEASNAVAAFARNKTKGYLTQLEGQGGCVSETGTGGTCADGKALARPVGIAVSPDNKHVYVASEGSNAVAVFGRNKLSGVLTQLSGTDGCVSADGTGGCSVAAGLEGVRGLDISPDGKQVYVVSQTANAVVVLGRNKTSGALSQLVGTAGCVSADATGGECAEGIALDGARAVAVTPNGHQVYVGSHQSDAVAVFSRATR